MARRKADTAALEERLGYRFRNREILDLALTHVSAAGGGGLGKNYQRLEFLGDRVLGLGVAEMLYRTFPDAVEGELSRRLAELVRRESCVEVALAWDLGPHLRLGAGEVYSGARRNSAVLADACEAVIGAVFLDGGYEAASALLERAFGKRLAASPRALRDPKTALQEWAQGRGLPTPTYALVERAGPDHAPEFRIAVKMQDGESEFGLGRSKQAAEQEAARNLLHREGIWPETDHGGP